MFNDFFAGIPVRDFGAALVWYEKLFGAAPSFLPHDTEAVWELAAHRYVYVVASPEHAGHAVHTVFVDDLDGAVAGVVARGIEVARQEEFGEGVRKVTFVDADGNAFAFGGTAGLASS